MKLPSLSISDEMMAGSEHLDSLMADAMIDDSVNNKSTVRYIL